MSIFTSKNGDDSDGLCWHNHSLSQQELRDILECVPNHSNKTNQQGYQSSQLVSKNTWWRSWTWPGVALLNAFYRRQSTFIPVTVKSLYSGSFGGCFHKLSIFKDVMQNTIESTSTGIRPACEHQKISAKPPPKIHRKPASRAPVASVTACAGWRSTGMVKIHTPLMVMGFLIGFTSETPIIDDGVCFGTELLQGVLHWSMFWLAFKKREADWWFQPLWKIWKSIGMMTKFIKIHVPNHQPGRKEIKRQRVDQMWDLFWSEAPWNGFCHAMTDKLDSMTATSRVDASGSLKGLKLP